MVLNGTGQLVDELDVAIAGRIAGSVEAEFLGVPGEANALINCSISDINSLIQGNPGAISVYYEVNVELVIPSFISILLMDPQGIIDAVDSVFQQAEEMSLGKNGEITRLDAPFVGRTIGTSLGAGTRNNFLQRARTAVIGEMEDLLKRYSEADEDGTATVADLLGNILSDVLGRMGILSGDVNVTYFEHIDNRTVPDDGYDSNKKNDYKSLMWTIPFGQSIDIVLPELDFELENDELPLQLRVNGTAPVLTIQWQFIFAFGEFECAICPSTFIVFELSTIERSVPEQVSMERMVSSFTPSPLT